MRIRLRPAHSPEVLQEMYAQVYDHTKWDEHSRRVAWTIHQLRLFIASHPEIKSVADLSCGDGRIIDALDVAEKFKSDLTGAHPIEQTIHDVTADLLICSETLEHLDDPLITLIDAAKNFNWICVTTPLGEDDPDKNYEHYWGWDQDGMSELLDLSHWAPRQIDTLNEVFYTYQFWIARSKWA